ncbi:Ig-like domain-containing protein [Anaerocolumna sp. MB42-C2]|uniref:Ig-like domain-containing protein n=1 Tax=Anaerocolumna sp. MB42-C2 TaxID=3070997 RepID=UPI0027E139E4|nr:Ig-like domain-containing protein [Anaerocolumna sp. MB42-C2]WMJ88882.1 Ig-like domain-containing protein [Anaerocolumna sp. MB42-C2]
MSIFKKVSVLGILFMMFFLFLAPVNVEAATVGDQLTTPENGWLRYDNLNPNITYEGNDWKTTNHVNHYDGTVAVTKSGNGIMKFKFKGTKIRIISSVADSSYRSTNYINLDGKIEQYSDIRSSWKTQIIVYEKTGLADGIHTVRITNQDIGKEFVLDAIDIDDTGYLVDYYQPTNLVATPGSNAIKLSWDAVDGATSYILKRSITLGGPYTSIEPVQKTVSGSAITCIDTEVTAGTTYYYVVSAVVSGTEGPKSDEASAVLPEVPLVNVLKVVLEVNEQLQLSVDDDLDVNTEMIWTSSDNAVATVDGNGVVTALKPGNTVITVASADGTYTDYINVLVVDDAKDLRLAVDLKVGKSCRLTVDDLTNTVNVTWSSMDPSVVTVASNGKVTAVSKGLALVTATDDTGKLIGQVYVRVRE